MNDNEIIGLSVVSGIARKLEKEFPGIAVYRETVTAAKFPHFFVHQLTLESQKELGNYWFLRYFVNIRYHEVNEPSKFPNIQEKLDNMALSMTASLDYIDWFDRVLRLTQAQPTKKVDGVLHGFYNIVTRATKPKPEVAKMLQLKLIEEIKIGGK